MDSVYFSVVTSAYDAESFIKRAVDSVLQQTYKNYEYVIVDNGSHDSTLDIIRKYETDNPERIKVYHVDDNLGISGGRNYGIQKAIGDYVCFLDADDYWEKNKLDVVEKQILKHSECSIFCHWEYHETEFDKKVVEYRQPKEKNQYEDMLFNGNCLSTSALAIERNSLNNVNGFDMNLCMGEEDYDLWLRLIKNGGRVHMIQEPLGHWVIRNDSMSSKVINHTTAVAELVKRHGDDLLKEGNGDRNLERKINRAISGCYCSAGRLLSKTDQCKEAQIFYIKSIKEYPLYYKSYAGLVLNMLHL